MNKLQISLLKEFKNPKYKNNDSFLKLTLCINKIINENEYNTDEVFNNFQNIRNIIEYFDITYQWGINNEDDLIVEKKINKLYNLLN